MLVYTLTKRDLSIQGLWFLQATNSNPRGAAIVLMNGKIQGGDAVHTYEGEYVLEKHPVIRGTICVNPVSPDSAFFGWFSLLGPFQWAFEGLIYGDDLIRGGIYRVDDPEVILSVQFTKRASLPRPASIYGSN